MEDWIGGGYIQACERRRTLPTIIAKGVATDLDAMSEDELRRNSYYRGFLSEHHIPRYAGGGRGGRLRAGRGTSSPKFASV
jgi:hypothetical protein